MDDGRDVACVSDQESDIDIRLSQESDIPTYDRNTLPLGPYYTYQKVRVAIARRMVGAFRVVTREGVVVCPDGYLAIDANGNPYPIAVDEFEQIYVQVDDPPVDDQV